jgi:hypothetical protein
MEELLNPRHPFKKNHQAQLEFLRSLPEGMRAYHARLFRLGNAAYRYQQLAEGKVTEEDFQDWLAGLPEKMRHVVAREGFKNSKSVLGLRRHALERRDLGYDAFMQATVSAEDWAYELEVRAANPALHR